eukprot:UN3862
MRFTLLSPTRRKLRNIDTAFAVMRHITSASVTNFLTQVDTELVPHACARSAGSPDEFDISSSCEDYDVESSRDADFVLVSGYTCDSNGDAEQRDAVTFVPVPDFPELAVGTIIKPKLDLRPKIFSEVCSEFWQGGEILRNDGPHDNQPSSQTNEYLPEVVLAMRHSSVVSSATSGCHASLVDQEGIGRLRGCFGDFARSIEAYIECTWGLYI